MSQMSNRVAFSIDIISMTKVSKSRLIISRFHIMANIINKSHFIGKHFDNLCGILSQ
jgi:hypothetical protein